jgi:hypothetical protein
MRTTIVAVALRIHNHNTIDFQYVSQIARAVVMAYSPAHTSSDTESDMGCCGANSMLVALVSMGLRIVDRFLCGKGLLQMKGLGNIAEECAGYNSGMIDQVECGLSNSCQMALAIIEEHAAERDVTDLEYTLPAGWCSVCPHVVLSWPRPSFLWLDLDLKAGRHLIL